jgi:hypothetical protein
MIVGLLVGSPAYPSSQHQILPTCCRLWWPRATFISSSMILPQIRSTQQTIIVEQIRARSPKCFFLSAGSTLSCTKEVDAYLTVIPQQQAGVVWTRNTLLLQHAAASCILCTPAVNLENLTNKIFQDPFLAKTFRRFSSPNLLTTQSVASTTTDRPKP